VHVKPKLEKLAVTLFFTPLIIQLGHINDGSTRDQQWIADGLTMDQKGLFLFCFVFLYYGSTMDQRWISGGSTMDHH